MDRLIHTSLSALKAAMARQTVTSSNLANVSTTGFRGEMSSVEAVWLGGAGSQDRAFASEEVRAADLHAGSVSQTGNPLDIAINGDAMLAVQADNGDEGYTRRGDLQVSDSGLLTTGDGHPVLGDSGPITIPPSDSIKIEKDGSIWIVPQGGDPSQPQQVDRLKLASAAGSGIVKHGDGLFRAKGASVLPTDPDARVTAGAIEGSNVEATTALVQMIEASRSWDTQIHLLTTARDLDSATTNLMRLPS